MIQYLKIAKQIMMYVCDVIEISTTGSLRIMQNLLSKALGNFCW